MEPNNKKFSRRNFCLCCLGSAAAAASSGWHSPRQAYAEARGMVSLIKDSAAISPIAHTSSEITSPCWKAPAATSPS